jgi:4-alpha-glucanotransferase
MLLVPPRRQRGRPGFGVIAPLYGLRGDPDWGVGSFTDLAGFAGLVARWGGDLAGTLPLYASFFRDPVDPSPYLPVSRTFWNELYLDIDALPELRHCPAAQETMSSPAFRAELDRLARDANADQGAVMAAKRQVLESCAEMFEAAGTDRRSAYDEFVARRPDLASYGQFRAFDEQRPGWRNWDVTAEELAAIADPATARYHRYVQFAADEQLAAAADRRDGRAGLYLDLPIGVHPDGYDVWAAPELFAAAGVGAPPDGFFSGGQSWGFPPLHPERIREDRYRYVIAAIRTAMRHAAAIRIDHVLGLHRLYWIPEGGAAADGAYVRYRDEELRAIVAIEAFRAGTTVIGEDLGTVSPEIRRAMDTDGMLHSFVYQFVATPQNPLPQPTMPSAASVGSHDLPRFATYWRGGDIEEQQARGEIDEREADTRWRIRRAIVDGVRRAAPVVVGSDADVRGGLVRCLQSLAIGPASYLFVDLADLELETVADNRPGTGPETGNWRHRLRRPMAAIGADPEVAGVMAEVAAGRDRAKARGAAA